MERSELLALQEEVNNLNKLVSVCADALYRKHVRFLEIQEELGSLRRVFDRHQKLLEEKQARLLELNNSFGDNDEVALDV